MNGCDNMSLNNAPIIDGGAAEEARRQRALAVAAHNANIDAQIAECTKSIGDYEGLKGEATSLAGAIEGYVESLREINNMLEQVVISNFPVGKGELLEECSALDGLREILLNIANECSQQITELNDKITSLKGQYWSL